MSALVWQKSSYSSGAGDSNCVEVSAGQDAHIYIRESDRPDEVARSGPHAWRDFLARVKADAAYDGEFAVTFGDDGAVRLHGDQMVTTTRPKWNAFVLGVKAGEFDHFAR